MRLLNGFLAKQNQSSQGVDDIRVRITEVKAEIFRLNTLPISKKAAAAQAATTFDQVFCEWPSVAGAINRVDHLIHHGQAGFSVQDFLLLAVLELDRERIRKLFIDYCSERAEAQGGIARVDKEKSLRSLSTQLLELEQEEERLISEAETSGIEIFRRGDADPRVVFDIRES